MYYTYYYLLDVYKPQIYLVLVRLFTVFLNTGAVITYFYILFWEWLCLTLTINFSVSKRKKMYNFVKRNDIVLAKNKNIRPMSSIYHFIQINHLEFRGLSPAFVKYRRNFKL